MLLLLLSLSYDSDNNNKNPAVNRNATLSTYYVNSES